MKHKLTKKVIALVLTVMLLISVVPMTAYASIPNWATNNVVFSGTSFGTNGYYNVISKKDYTLVPGAAVESEMVINNATGTRRQVMHIIEVDPSNPDVSVLPGYYNIDKDLTDVNNWKAAGVTDLADYYENELGYNVVGAMNTDLDYTDNAPRVLVYNGQNLAGYAGAAAPRSVLYVWNNDGEISCQVTSYNKATLDAGVANGTLLHAISVSFAMVVNNGELVSKTEERTSEKAARSMVGVKEDGTLVLVMNDGRNANNSVGFCNYEEGEAMLALGCKWAANCDGGGSSSFVTKRAGEDTTTMRCVPCDGAERPTKSSVVVVSNVGPTGELNNVNIDSDYDYFAPGTTYEFGAEAIDTHGYAMDMPADVTWSLSDDSFGTIADGTFVSNGTLGDVDVQVESDGAVVGTKTIHIANPTTLNLSASETTLPYSTADKIKTTTIPVVSKIGEDDVYTDGSTYSTVIAPAGSGSIDGLVFTATDDQTIAQSVVTLTYLPTNTEMTYTVNYGKGSEILWDFEDGIDGWLGQQDAHDWQVAHGVTPFDEDASVTNSLYSAGQMNASSRSKTFVSTVENGGQVHNGNQALGVEYDFRGADFNSWVYMILFNVLNENGENPDCVLRDTENGKNATAIGMWVYLPVGFRDVKNAGSLALQMNLFYRKADGTEGQAGVNMQYNGKNINALTEADIPDSRWIYVKGALPTHPYVALTDPLQSNYRAPSIFRMYVKPSVAQTLTYYYDDITLDYSSAVDDREAPVISNPCYAYTDTAITINNGDEVPYYVDFSANAADFAASNATGIDPTSAAVYLDGVKFNNAGYFNGQIIAEDYPLSEGQHTVIFEISDNLGNIAQLKRTINCTSTNFQGLYLDGHNDSGSAPLAGSMYYLDLKAKNIENIKKVETTIDLQTANTWEAEHLEVADGFTASYTVNEAEPEFVTFTIEKTGDVALTGDQTLLTVPVRVWDWDESWPFGGDGSATRYGKAARYSAYGEPVLKVTADVVYGKVNYIQNAETTTASFGGSYSVDTVVDGNKTSGLWHTHDAELTLIPDKAPTCTEEGYTGRTYCETCQSIVDWGTTVPATGHTYSLHADHFECDGCGLVYQPGTGLFELNGKTYYAINNNLLKGWQDIDGDMYFFSNLNYEGLNGNQVIAEIPYEFENGKLLHGSWVTDDIGTRYYYGGGFYKCTAGNPNANVAWETIDGDTYGFDRQGYRHEGIRLIVSSNDAGKLYEFTNDGKLVGEYNTNANGIFQCNGQIVYLIDGVPQATGLILVDGYYYYITSGYTAIVNASYNCTHTNGLLPGGTYTFGPDGKMEQLNGPQDSGYFYIDGVMQKCYQLIEYNGDYYFINDGNKYSKNTRIYLSDRFVEGTDFVVGYYDFDEDGKLIIKNGPQADGYFYNNGARVSCYKLVEFEGNYYFISDAHKIAKNAHIYLNATFIGENPFTPGYYDFDADGKLVMKNGPQDDGYFYINAVRQSCYQLVEYEGDYYFINDAHKLAKNQRIYLSQTYVEGTDLAVGYYEFGDDYKLILKNGPQADGYFYRNGLRLNAYQLVEYEGDYYFVNDSNRIAKDRRIYLGEQFVAGTGLAVGYYDFDSDGKLQLINGPQADGSFYSNGTRVLAYALVEYNGDYYFVNDGNKLAKDRRIYLGEQFVADTDFAVGYYDFDSDGKLHTINGPQPDGSFYLNSVRQLAYQLIEFEGDYYFVNDSNRIAKNRRIYLSDQFVAGTDLAVGYYDFDADGKLHAINGPQEDGYFYLNGVRQNAYQLVKFNDTYYFVDDGNRYAKNKRIYLSAAFIGDEPIEVGYYNFGADGTIQGLKYYKNAQGDIVGDLGLIFLDGEYYYVRENGQLAIGNYKINYLKTNDYLKGDKTFYFDENGVMDTPAYYVKGIRDGRDIGTYFKTRNSTPITTDTGKSIKEGLLIRGAEIDGAINPMTDPNAADVKAYAIDLLKNTYDVKLDMDLRNRDEVALTSMGVTDPLGADVEHKFYNMALYDYVNTTDCKAKVKAIFDDLCDEDNYPIYCHCSYGLDRTGIVCFLLEGALGIPERQCVIEYCTTKGSDEPAIQKVQNALKSYSGSTFKDRVVSYLISCGITAQQISDLRNIYLED